MKRLSPAANLLGKAFDALVKDSQMNRVVLKDSKLEITAIAYRGDCDNAIIGVLKKE